jgi:hypothetical protein
MVGMKHISLLLLIVGLALASSPKPEHQQVQKDDPMPECLPKPCPKGLR